MISLGITFASVLTFLVIGMVSMRRAFFWFLAALPFLPYYFALPIGEDGAGLAAARLSAYMLFLLMSMSLVVDAKGWAPTFAALRRHSWVIWLFATIAMTRLAGTLLHQSFGTLFYWADEHLLLALMLLLSVRVFLDLDNIAVFARVILGAALLHGLFAVIEAGLGRHLLLGIVDIQVSTVGDAVLDGRIRSGGHRVQTLFDNPLSLAEYMLYAMVAVFFLYRPERYSRNLITWGVLALALLAVLLTRSRFPLLLLALSVVIFQVLQMTVRMPPLARFFVTVLLTGGGLVLAWGGGYVLFNFETYSTQIVSFFGGSASDGAASVVGRGLQYSVISNEVLSNPYYGLLGEGHRSDLHERLEVNLDNHYLRMLIEGGLIGVVALMGLILTMGLSALRGFRRVRRLALAEADALLLRRFYLCALYFFITFFFAKFFLSMNFNNYLLYVFTGAVVAVNYQIQQARTAAVSRGAGSPVRGSVPEPKGLSGMQA